jgi:hypothetical protein
VAAVAGVLDAPEQAWEVDGALARLQAELPVAKAVGQPYLAAAIEASSKAGCGKVARV